MDTKIFRAPLPEVRVPESIIPTREKFPPLKPESRPVSRYEANKKLIEQMIKHFSALEDPKDKGFITLESLKQLAYPPANQHVPPKLQQIARDFLNNDALRRAADVDPHRRLDDKYDRENLEIVLRRAPVRSLEEILRDGIKY